MPGESPGAVVACDHHLRGGCGREPQNTEMYASLNPDDFAAARGGAGLGLHLWLQRQLRDEFHGKTSNWPFSPDPTTVSAAFLTESDLNQCHAIGSESQGVIGFFLPPLCHLKLHHFRVSTYLCLQSAVGCC